MSKTPSEPGELVGRMSACMAELDADRMTPATVAALFRAFAELSRLSGAGEMVASKAAEAPEWKEGGHRIAAAWMAATSGSGLGEAISRLETAERLGSLAAIAQALRRGALSTQKAKEIAAVAVTTPDVEAELLSAAETGTMKTLKEYCRRVNAQRGSAADENARYAAIDDSRYFRHWTDPDAAFEGTFKLTPDQGALLLMSLDARADTLFDDARKNEVHDSPAAYAADALVDLVTRPSGVTRTGKPHTVVHVRVDALALRRGHVESGELCEIAGVGPVPVSTVKALLPDAFVKLLVTDGVDIATVCHVGRTFPAHLRGAIEERDPTCVVPGCDVATGLEVDHWDTDFAYRGPTSMANPARLPPL